MVLPVDFIAYYEINGTTKYLLIYKLHLGVFNKFIILYVLQFFKNNLNFSIILINK